MQGSGYKGDRSKLSVLDALESKLGVRAEREGKTANGMRRRLHVIQPLATRVMQKDYMK